MAIFSCKKCGEAIVVADDRVDREVICEACQTSQEVPWEVRQEKMLPHAIPRLDEGGPRAKVPEYVLAMLVATFLWMVGIVTIVVGIGNVGSNVLVGVIGISSGVMTIGIAMILSFARQIARQTYRVALDV